MRHVVPRSCRSCGGFSGIGSGPETRRRPSRRWARRNQRLSRYRRTFSRNGSKPRESDLLRAYRMRHVREPLGDVPQSPEPPGDTNGQRVPRENTAMTMSASSRPVGFRGLGLMGEPMALNVVRAGIPLIVWNRSAGKTALLAQAGAAAANDLADLFGRCDVIIIMLRNEAATDSVLARHTPRFGSRVSGRTIVNMATPSPGYSAALEAEILAHGGQYLEAPVSGSRKPAEAGELVAMLAGAPATIALARPTLNCMCRTLVTCGPTPNALTMKFAVNLFMICMVTGLAEAMHFAQCHGIDLAKFVAVLDASPMASDVSRVKAAKLASHDYAAQATIPNVLENIALIAEAARAMRTASPLLDLCHSLYAEAAEVVRSDVDMIAVIRAIERRSAAII